MTLNPQLNNGGLLDGLGLTRLSFRTKTVLLCFYVFAFSCVVEPPPPIERTDLVLVVTGHRTLLRSSLLRTVPGRPVLPSDPKRQSLLPIYPSIWSTVYDL